MNGSNAFADFESFMSSSLATDLSMELEPMLHPTTVYPTRQRKPPTTIPVISDERLLRLENQLSGIQHQLQSIAPVKQEPLDSSDNIASKLQKVCQELEHLKLKVGQFENDSVNVNTTFKPVRESIPRHPNVSQKKLDQDVQDRISEMLQSKIPTMERSTSPTKPTTNYNQVPTTGISYNNQVPTTAIPSYSNQVFKEVPTPGIPSYDNQVPTTAIPSVGLSPEIQQFIKSEIARQIEEYEKTRLRQILVELTDRIEQRLEQRWGSKSVRWDTSSVKSVDSRSASPSKEPSESVSRTTSGRSTPIDKSELVAEKLLKKLKHRLDSKLESGSTKQEKGNLKSTSNLKSTLKSNRPTKLKSSLRQSQYTRPTLASQLKTKAFY